MIKSLVGSALILTVVFASAALGDVIPDCMSNAGAITVDNQQVIDWKSSTKNQFQARAHVKGTIDRIFPDHSGHHHFEITIGPDSGDVLEVIYNEDFGPAPEAEVGMTVEACGDYITSIAQSGPYPPSPSGAIIHWVHMAPNLNKHPSGYLVMDGVLVGQDIGHAGPKRHKKRRH
jgi:hypothetical protein